MFHYLSAALTDAGLVKKVNQDAAIIEEGVFNDKHVLLGAVCDGMGGLAEGEVASSMMISRLSGWFEEDLPEILAEGGREMGEWMNESLKTILTIASNEIRQYGRSIDAGCGTTAAILVLFEGQFFLVNVGDSRIYYDDGMDLSLLSHDQSYVQKLIDEGKLTEEEAEKHPKRSVLLQCIGAGPGVKPQFVSGVYHAGDTFLICSDGFRKTIPDDEMRKILHLNQCNTESELYQQLSLVTNLCKERLERDNITSLVLRPVISGGTDA